MPYPNGRIPLDLLVHLGGEHYLMPGTYRRWLGFVADVKAETGVTMRITPGPNGYRWYEAQVDAKKDACARGRCQDAATAGDSSHGGLWRGMETCAIDVTNWASIKWEVYKRLAEKWGFTVLYFSWEPWHLIDKTPWVAPASSGGGSTPTPALIPEDDEMYLYKQVQGELVAYILWIPGRAKYQVTQDANQANRWAVLVGKDAKLISDAAVAELFNLQAVFS